MKKLGKAAALALVLSCVTGSGLCGFGTETAVYAEQTKGDNDKVDLSEGHAAAGLAVYLGSLDADILTAEKNTEDTTAAEAKETASKATEDKADKKTEDKETKKDAKLLTPDVSAALNIRKKADTDSKVVGQLFRGCTAEVIKEKDDWYKIKSGDVTGWVSAEYVFTGTKAKKFLAKIDPSVAKVTASSLNLREEKNTDCDIVALLEEGSEYMVVSEGKEWIEIQYTSSVTGYVAAEYVSVKDKTGEAISASTMKAQEKAIKKEKDKRAEEAAKKAAAQAAAKAAASASSSSSSGSSSSGSSSSGSATSASSDEVTLLAALCQHEAGTNYEGCVAVANVVLNRKRSSSYPNSISGVIYQSGQFAGVNNGALNRFLSNPNSTCLAAARAALSGTNNIGSRMQFRCARTTGYHSNSVEIGGNVFF